MPDGRDEERDALIDDWKGHEGLGSAESISLLTTNERYDVGAGNERFQPHATDITTNSNDQHTPGRVKAPLIARIREATRPLPSAIIAFVLFLLPSFLSGVPRRFLRKDAGAASTVAAAEPVPPNATKPLRRTAYLDGIRGLASLGVCMFHIVSYVFDIKQRHHHGQEPSTLAKLSQLPILGLWNGGPVGIRIFFVISGFVLSIKPLSLMNAGDHESLMRSLSSSLLRRPFRIFLPTLAAMAMLPIASWFGFVDEKVLHKEQTPLDTLGHQLVGFVKEGAQMFQLFNWDQAEKDFHPVLGKQLWTIPVEVRGSIVLFGSMMLVARMSRWWRCAVVAGLGFTALAVARWELVLFWAGCLMADIQTSSEAQQASTIAPSLPSANPTSDKITTSSWKGKILTYIILLTGLYLGSYPARNGPQTPGFIYLSLLIPLTWSDKLAPHFWIGIGGILIVLAITRLPGFQRFLECRIVQYIAAISFSLYLVQYAVNHTFGAFAREIFGGGRGKEMGAVRFCAYLGLTLGVTVWVADVFNRGVELRCSRVEKWIDRKVNASVRDG